MALPENKLLTISGPFATGDIVIAGGSIVEEMGRPFRMELELYSERLDLTFDELIGQEILVTVHQYEDGPKRYFHGHVTEFGQLMPGQRYARYRMVVRPWLWLHTRTSDCEIFQNLNAPDIIKDVFGQGGVGAHQDKLTGNYQEREYCVQYRETNFAFVSRLMEQEGIYYYFEHSDGAHTLLMCDDPSAHTSLASDYQTIKFIRSTIAGSGEPGVYSLEVGRTWRTGVYTHTDYDFTRPRTDIKTALSSPLSQQAYNSFEFYDFPGQYVQEGNGEHLANVRLQELQADQERVHMEGTALGMAVGYTFTLDEFPFREDQNREYLVVKAYTQLVGASEATAGGGVASGERFRTKIEAIPAEMPYRSPSITPKPVVWGPQTARVVGDQSEEITTDEYGRVKVKFHWDRADVEDVNRTCFIRVAQIWAGQGFGTIFIPRHDEEVVVEFLEGDPDRPLIVGRVYNAVQTVPYNLPENKRIEGIKTHSTLEGDQNTFNELRFEDDKDKELIYLHAERDMHRYVENNDKVEIGFDKREEADGNQEIAVFNNQVEKVGTPEAAEGSRTTTIHNNDTVAIGNDQAADGSQSVSIYNNRTVTLDQGNDGLTINTGDRTTEISQGNDTLTISQGDLTITVSAGKISMEAGTEIKLTVGNNSITLDTSGITVAGAQVDVTGDAALSLGAPNVSVAGDAATDISGGIVQIN